jgi:hypothetical protein
VAQFISELSVRNRMPGHLRSGLLRCTASIVLGCVSLAALTVASPVHAQTAAQPIFEVLDPRGEFPIVTRVPLSKRLTTLKGKRITMVKSWPGNSGFDGIIPVIAADLEKRGAKVTVRNRNTTYSSDDPELWKDLHATADAFVYVGAASSSTTAYAFRWSALLESRGLPGVVANFGELNSVGDQTNGRYGVQVRRAVFDYPPEKMDDAARNDAIARISAALTSALTSEEKATGDIPPPARPDVLMRGSISDVQDRFYEMGLTDGLPIIPPTRELVDAMLKGTSHSPDLVVANNFPPEGLKATVRDVAINGVMAGCGPEHMPVLLATMEAFQKYEHNSMLRSTNSFSFMQVVNGPIRNEIKMNSGTNAVGPGNRSNACMGRALRMFITNLGEGQWGTNLMAVIGSNSNYAFMFAENEEQSPWTTFSEDAGFRKDENVLTLFSGGWAHSGNYGLGTGIEDVPPDLASFQIAGGAVLIVSPARAQALKEAGMSKADLEEYLHINACRPLGDLRKEGRFQALPAGHENMPPETCIPRFQKGTIKVLVAGNDASPMMQGWSMYRPLTVSIDRWR